MKFYLTFVAFGLLMFGLLMFGLCTAPQHHVFPQPGVAMGTLFGAHDDGPAPQASERAAPLPA